MRIESCHMKTLKTSAMQTYNFFMDCSPRKLGKADPLPLSSLILLYDTVTQPWFSENHYKYKITEKKIQILLLTYRSERFVNSDMLKGIGPCNKDPSICLHHGELHLIKEDTYLWYFCAYKMCSITNSLTHNFSSLFNFPQKSGILPEKLVLEILLLAVSIVKHYQKTLHR